MSKIFPKKAYVLDAFAVLCYLQNEPGANQVEGLLQLARGDSVTLMMTWVNLGEVYYRVQREYGPEEAVKVMALVKSWPLQILEAGETLTLSAGDLKASYPMSYADAYAGAAAKLHKALLVTGDKEFTPLEVAGELDILWISKGGQEL